MAGDYAREEYQDDRNPYSPMSYTPEWSGAGGSYTSGGSGAQGIYDSFAQNARSQQQRYAQPSWTQQTWTAAPPVQPSQPVPIPQAPQPPQYQPPQWTGAQQGTVMQPPSPRQTPNPAWNTDGYAAPQSLLGGYGTVMAGWDQGKWADPNHQTPKYVLGRVLSKYPASKQGAAAAAAELALAYPGTRFNGKDKIAIPGIGEYDVLQNSGTNDPRQMRWQFLDMAAADPGEAQTSQPMVDPYAMLLASLGGYQQGQMPMMQPSPQPAAPAVDPNMAAMMQQLQTLMAELRAGQQSSRGAAPRFAYY